jgi:hypothetical protein
VSALPGQTNGLEYRLEPANREQNDCQTQPSLTPQPEVTECVKGKSMNSQVSTSAMHIAGLIFLWANRVYCAAMIIHGARVIPRSGNDPMRSTL